jgi:Ca2+-transporting ATPase
MPLLCGVLAAQSIHVLCMQLPGIGDVLSLQPVSLLEWGSLLALASTLLAVSEVDKWWSRRRQAAGR